MDPGSSNFVFLKNIQRMLFFSFQKRHKTFPRQKTRLSSRNKIHDLKENLSYSVHVAINSDPLGILCLVLLIFQPAGRQAEESSYLKSSLQSGNRYGSPANCSKARKSSTEEFLEVSSKNVFYVFFIYKLVYVLPVLNHKILFMFTWHAKIQLEMYLKLQGK